MTTLDLAAAIAREVLAEPPILTNRKSEDPTSDRYAQAVLRVLVRHQSWFCRVPQNLLVDGIRAYEGPLRIAAKGTQRPRTQPVGAKTKKQAAGRRSRK